MKKINLLIFNVLLCNLVGAREQALPKIFHDVRNGDKEAVRNELYNCADCTIKDKDGNTVLHIAAQNGFKEIAELLLEYNDNWFYKPTLPNIDDVNNNGDTALHTAVSSDDHDYENRAEVLQYLLTKNPELAKKTNKENFSPAFIAVKKDDPRFIRIFTAHQLDLGKHKRNGETVFTYAVKEHKPKTIHYCAHKTSLGNVANNDNKTPTSLAIDSENIQLLELFKENINTFIANTSIKPVHYAAANGKYKALDYIIDKNNVSVDEPDEDGNPPLFHAIDNNDEQMMNHLLYLGADRKKCNNQGENALAVAAHNKHIHLIKVVKTKLNLDIDARDKKGQTALMSSSIAQMHDVMEELISLGANIRITDNLRENILHKAARSGDKKGTTIALKCDKLLLSDLDLEGNTPLFTAMYNGQFSLAKILFDAGSPLDTINKKNETILHEVTKQSNNKALKNKKVQEEYEALRAELLKKINPNLINQKNLDDETTIFFAAKNDDAIGIRNLIRYKAEYRAITNIHGLTPMHCAAGSDAVEAMQELERNGISLKDRSPHGNTPGHIAAGQGNIRTIRYLQSKDGLLEICNNNGDNVFAYGTKQGKLEVTKMLLCEQYYINGTVSRLITELKNNPSRSTHDAYQFLAEKHTDRIKQCQMIIDVDAQARVLMHEKQQLIDALSKGDFFNNMLLQAINLPSSLGKTITVNELYYMSESERNKIRDQRVQWRNEEYNKKAELEKTVAKMRKEEQKAREQKKAAEKAKQERILQQERDKQERIRKEQQEELDRIAQENRQRAAQENARLKQELERAKATQSQNTAQQIAAQQGTSIAEQKAELDRLAAEKYAKDIAANNKRIADEKARVRAEEDARAKQARATERARIEAENARIAQAKQPIANEEVLEEGECCISGNACTEDHGVKRLPCTNCHKGSERTCKACIDQWIITKKARNETPTCPICRATLSEKLKQ